MMSDIMFNLIKGIEMKFINPETKTFKVFTALKAGETLTAATASKRFGVKNLSAEASRLRQHGFAVYANTRKAGNGVTVTEYVPAARLDKSSLVEPLDQRYVYAVVPPDTLRLAAPVELPKQRTLVPLMLAANAAAGSVIVTEAVVEHPLASVTVTV
jgi:hypothetical protein